MTTTIWIGDLLVSINVLAPANDSTVEAMAHLLGLERTAMPSAQPMPSEQKAPLSGVTSAVSSNSAFVASSSFPVERLQPIAPRTTLSARRDIIKPLQLTAAVSNSPPSTVPLLSPLAGRLIVKELITSSRFGPDPDIDRMVDALSCREIPQPVPLQENRTLARGAQVLVDYGEGMEPFADDQKLLVNLVRQLAGDTLVDVRAMHEIPERAGPVDPWDPPPSGAPVLALTDLGLAGRSERGALGLVTAWQSVAVTLAMRGSSLIALIPWPAARWPVQLRACMQLVFWDRSTTSALARQTRCSRPVK